MDLHLERCVFGNVDDTHLTKSSLLSVRYSYLRLQLPGEKFIQLQTGIQGNNQLKL
jgi:hypothetical protein